LYVRVIAASGTWWKARRRWPRCDRRSEGSRPQITWDVSAGVIGHERQGIGTASIVTGARATPENSEVSGGACPRVMRSRARACHIDRLPCASPPAHWVKPLQCWSGVGGGFYNAEAANLSHPHCGNGTCTRSPENR